MGKLTTSILGLFLAAVYFTPASAQGLYNPRDIKKALASGTRSADGKPGKNYWQNNGRYEIALSALPPDRTIKGTEKITYFNNSPDTLKRLNIKLLLNIHKAGAPRDGGTSADYLTSGIHIDSFIVNGKSQPWPGGGREYTQQPVRLQTPLLPHDSVRLSFTWTYPISRQSGREGMIDSTTYFLAYFYPRVAVYDDYAGWDNVPFTDGKEFYSDFNDYKVSITVPANYIVWGTGTLEKPGSVLQPAYARKLLGSFTSDALVHMATLAELQSGKVTQPHTNTWTFTASKIPDMTFGISNHFVWDASSVELDKKSHRRVSVQAAYNDTSADFHHMVEYGKHGIYWLSNNWPGVPYPYEKSTIFQGFAGMEYPMMVNDESYSDTTFSRFVAEHEIAHTYMPFYMGINETRYGFMDEGWATTFEYLISTAGLGKKRADENFKQFRVRGFTENSAADMDIPIITPGSSLGGRALGNNEYGKAALGYLAMKDLLGDAAFRKCLHGYMARWNGKHPNPWDFFNTFSDLAGGDINWFWTNWYFGNNYNDLAIGSVENGKAVINNIGGLYSPFDLILTYADGSKETLHQTPSVWHNHGSSVEVALPAAKKIASLEIDGGIFMDTDPANNTWKAKA